MISDPAVIRPATLKLLKKLSTDSRLDEHFLVGGTALALQFGHRLSIDLDLFTLKEFEADHLQQYLENAYGFTVSDKFTNGLMGFIEGIKVDLIRHAYPLVEPMISEPPIRMAHALDISAMKLNAISGNGTRVKDFYDMYTLLEHHPLTDMLGAYVKKYPNSGVHIATKSLAYFDDIDFEREPALMVRNIDFAQVRERLEAAVLDPYRVF